MSSTVLDSVCIIIYDGKNLPPPILSPQSPEEDSIKFEIRFKKHIEEKSKQIGEINSEYEMNWFSQDFMDKDGKFNPGIIWETKECFRENDMEKLIEIVKGNKGSKLFDPAMCFFPRHCLVVYKQGLIDSYYEICFECNRVRLNSNNYINNVDYDLLKDIFKNHKIAMFENEEEFMKFKKTKKSRKKHWP